MLSYRSAADALTWLRLLLGLLLPWLGYFGGEDALPAAMVCLMLGWLTDVLDGALARKDSNGKQTWIGANDLAVDVCVSVGVLGYLAVSGYILTPFAFSYILLIGLLIAYFESRTLAMLAQALPYVGMLYFCLRDAPIPGVLAVIVLLLAVIFTWPRFPQQVVPHFLDGMRSLAGGLKH